MHIYVSVAIYVFKLILAIKPFTIFGEVLYFSSHVDNLIQPEYEYAYHQIAPHIIVPPPNVPCILRYT